MSDKTETPSDVTTTVPADAEPAKIADGAGKEIPREKLRDEDVGNESADDIILANPQWGSVSMLANAASFDIVVQDIVAKAHTNQFWNVERNGLFSISNGGGSLLETFLQKFGIIDDDGKKKDDEDNVDAFSDAVHDQREEARRQQEEWSQSEHTFAGQTMTGDEWSAMKKWFDDPDKVAGWEQAMMAETGQSLEEVRRTGGKLRRFYELVDKQAQGKPLTTDEKAEFEKLNNDRDVQTGVTVQQKRMEGMSSDVEVKAQTAEAKSDSTMERSNLIAARANLNAEPLTPTYNEVAKDRNPAAATPDPAQPSPEAKPIAVAATTPLKPSVTMNANLDMG